MPYESFSITSLRDNFGLTMSQTEGHFDSVPAVQPSDWLKTTIGLQLPLIMGKASEKARSELLVMPVLVEVREKHNRQIAVFSGIKFDVDRKANLYGYCDFLISRDPLLLDIEAPVVALAEAKREDLTAGTPQCIAEMIAAQRFNAARKRDVPVIYGAVTSGTDWRFLQLKGTTVTIDLREYPITELPQILGILVHMAS